MNGDIVMDDLLRSGVDGGDGATGGGASPMTAAEYSESVQQWLQQAYQWHSLAAGFPAYLAYQASIRNQQQLQSVGATVQDSQSSVTGHQVQVWREFKIASLWKRFAAELIDFAILFVIKLLITFIAVDWFEVMDLDRYDRGLLLAATTNGDLDFMRAMEVTSDILVLESIHKLLVCIFETVCTYKGSRRQKGGATPGKLIVGIRIYHFDQIVQTAEQGIIQITPASDLGLLRASIRAVVKNIASTFIFPSWLTIFFSPHYRAVHDVMSRSIVLEVPLSDNARGPVVNQQPN